MITPYSVFKNIIPTSVRTFIRDLDSAYHKLEKEIEAKNQYIQDLEQNYNNLQFSYQTLQASYDKLVSEQHNLQIFFQEITKLYQILGRSHRRLLEYNNKIIQVITEKPIAYDSPDHIEPWGTKYDNSINLNFNYKLAKCIPLKDLTVLDLGCSGGGFVKSIIDLGCFAVGIEGSDYSKIRGRAEWSTIPGNLFTADVTEPLRVLVNSNSKDEEVNHPFEFTVITAWEFIEHISPDKLSIVFQNILTHLKKGGIVIMSVSPNEDVINGVKLHQTVENKDWWLAECYRNGFIQHEEVVKYFDKDFVRGEPNAPNSFHLILTRTSESLPLLNFNSY